LNALGAPTNISALTTVTQDNTGNVTFLPRGEGVSSTKLILVMVLLLQRQEVRLHTNIRRSVSSENCGNYFKKKQRILKRLQFHFSTPRILFLQLQLELISIEVSAKADLETFSGLLW
jgi:hypothetical protein